MDGGGTCVSVAGRAAGGCGRSLTTVGWRLAEMSLAFAVSVWRFAAGKVPPHHSEIPAHSGKHGRGKKNVSDSLTPTQTAPFGSHC